MNVRKQQFLQKISCISSCVNGNMDRYPGKTSRWPAQDKATFPDHCRFDWVVEESSNIAGRGRTRVTSVWRKALSNQSQHSAEEYLNRLEVNVQIIFRRCSNNIAICWYIQATFERAKNLNVPKSSCMCKQDESPAVPERLSKGYPINYVWKGL